ncbi:MAG: ankyrin repeat domain-containing protein [Candidatus Limnocylindrales bacterium]
MTTTDDLIAAVQDQDAGRVAQLVVMDQSLANARDEAGVSAIMLSRYRFDRAVTDALLAADPDLDVYEATTLGFADRLREVLAGYPDLATAFSADGFTALHFAAFFGKAEAARILLVAGAPVNIYSRNSLHVQPLHSAAAGRHHEVCRVLLAAGANVNASQQDSYTPLHAAARHGDDELVELFLSAGADSAARLEDGKTPADSAEAAGHLDVARRIREIAAAG